MKDITVGIKLELYLKEWLDTAMGRPVRFPSKSYENACCIGSWCGAGRTGWWTITCYW